ncbi:hypothetical protein M5C72_05560 [Companilactobacillus allii]|nr:hypothetical protein [Companilactobacillus allii]USQ69684.1 hypothetical protein M5C72_05560 [Companilactobacillus allii]
MQVKQSHLNNTLAQTIISNTATFIDNNFDFKLGNITNNVYSNTLKQMPHKQLNIFAKQSFQKQYFIIVTMVNDEQFEGKLIRCINENKYVLKINSSFYKIVELNQIRSINLV